jgi:bacillolysin
LKKFFILTIIPFLLAFSLKSQITVDSSFFAEIDTTLHFYKIKDGYKTTSSDAIIKIKSLYNLSSSNSFIEYNSHTDIKGNIHRKFQHYYNGIQVYGSQLFLHGDAKGNILKMNGFVINDFSAIKPVRITENQAISKALNSINSLVYFWQDTTYENNIKIKKNDPLATYYPTAELMYYPNPAASKYLPAYRVAVSSLIPFNKEYLFINATDGSLIDRGSAIKTCNSDLKEVTDTVDSNKSKCSESCTSGTGKTLFYGSQYINVSAHRFSWNYCKYRLYDNCNGTIIHTKSRTEISNNSGSNPNLEYTDHNKYFNFNATMPGVTAHWGLKMTLEYYRNNFGREGWDGAGKKVNAYCNDNQLGNSNAWFDPLVDELNFGIGSVADVSRNAMVSLDIVGHEYTHGISKYEANFHFYGEPAALEESFSDIFGEMIEFYAKSINNTGTSFSYIHGNEVYYHIPHNVGNRTFYSDRDISNPHNSLLPDTYNGTYWLNPSQSTIDRGGAHINVSVQNFWFYLLAEGGSGTNDLNNQYCVQAIGKDKAIRITYHNLINYMSTYSNFSAARLGSIQSAIDLYGSGSNEVAQVINAWYAVGVGPQFAGDVVINNHTVSGSEVINYNSSILFNDLHVPATTSLTVTSNTKITMKSNSKATSGCYFHAYITPACQERSFISNLDNGDVYNFDKTSNINSIASNSKDSSKQTAKINDNININPNPNDGTFQISITKNNKEIGVKEIKVFNIIGEVIWSTGASSNNLFTIDITVYPPGIYYVHTVNEQSEIEVKKFIKQ